MPQENQNACLPIKLSSTPAPSLPLTLRSVCQPSERSVSLITPPQPSFPFVYGAVNYVLSLDVHLRLFVLIQALAHSKIETGDILNPPTLKFKNRICGSVRISLLRQQPNRNKSI